jgi:pterin-4a-carbinolamine dehydratase
MAKKTLKKRPKLLTNLSLDWSVNDELTELTRTVKFSDYLHAFMFVTRVSIHAEVQKFYPVLTLKQKSVKVLITSEAGRLTTTETSFAKRIDDILLSTTKR